MTDDSCPKCAWLATSDAVEITRQLIEQLNNDLTIIQSVLLTRSQLLSGLNTITAGINNISNMLAGRILLPLIN